MWIVEHNGVDVQIGGIAGQAGVACSGCSRKMARQGDWLGVSGKGSETYQGL